MSRDEPWEQVAFFDGALAYDMLPQRLKDAANNPEPHNATAVPVDKLDSYRPYRFQMEV